MKSEFLIAVTQLAAERNLPQDMVVTAVEAALASAYIFITLVPEELNNSKLPSPLESAPNIKA